MGESTVKYCGRTHNENIFDYKEAVYSCGNVDVHYCPSLHCAKGTVELLTGAIIFRSENHIHTSIQILMFV